MLQQAADDMAKPSHRHSPQDGAPRGIRRRAVARRVHDAAPDVQQDVDVEEEMVLQMEARALAVLLAERQHPGSLIAPAQQRQRRSRVTSRGSAGQSPQSRRSSRGSSAAESSSSAEGPLHGIRRRTGARRVHDAAQDVQQDVDVEEEMEARALAVLLAGRQHPGSRLAPPRQRRSRVTPRDGAGQGPQSRRSSRGSSAVESSSSASCQGSYSHLSISSLQSLVNRYDAVHEVSSTTTLSFQSSLVDRLNRVLEERDVGNSELERRGSESIGIQTKEITALVLIALFPPVALLAAMATVLYLW